MRFNSGFEGLRPTVTSLLAVPNLGTWEPHLPKTEETLKIYATG